MKFSIGSFAIILSISSVLVAGKNEKKQLIVTWNENLSSFSAPENKYIIRNKRSADQMNKEDGLTTNNKRYRPILPSATPQNPYTKPNNYFTQKKKSQNEMPHRYAPLQHVTTVASGIPNLHVPYTPRTPLNRYEVDVEKLKERFLSYKTPITQGEKEESILPSQTIAIEEKFEEENQARDGVISDKELKTLAEKFLTYGQQAQGTSSAWQTARVAHEKEKEYFSMEGIDLNLITHEQFIRFSRIDGLDLKRRKKDVLYYQKATYFIMKGATIQAVASLVEPTSKTARKDLITEINFLTKNGILTKEERSKCL